MSWTCEICKFYTKSRILASLEEPGNLVSPYGNGELCWGPAATFTGHVLSSYVGPAPALVSICSGLTCR